MKPARLFFSIPAERNRTNGNAGILAGLAFRLRKLPKGRGHERKLLNDGLLYLQATKTGCTVLTRNLEDFDILNQLVPSGRVLFYRPDTASGH